MAKFQSAMVHVRAGRCKEALVLLEEVRRTQPGSGLWRPLAQCREKTGDLRGAKAALAEYLKAPDAPNREQTTADLSRVEGQIAKLPAPKPPAIQHQPASQCTRGEPLTVTARITSSTGSAIVEPTLHLRIAGIPGFNPTPMQADPANPGTFTAQVPASVTRDEFDYYLEAADEAGAPPGRNGTPDMPFHVAPAAKAQPRRRGLRGRRSA